MKIITKMLNDILNEYSNYKFDSDYSFNGKIVPRVTKILSKCIHNDNLMYWANNLGFKHKSYQKTLNDAANIGTQCHNSIDSFLMDNSFTPLNTITKEARNAYDSFRVWFSELSTLNNVEIIWHEHQIVCPYFGGTLDGLYKIDGKIYLVDYKTSNHISMNYYLQLAAYRYILKNYYDIEIDGIIILQLSKYEIDYCAYSLDFDNPNHLSFMNQCEKTFLSLVYSYYNLTITEDLYNNLN